jgi:hemolysin III
VLAQVELRPAFIAPIDRVKPRWRGVSHQYAFFASLLPGLALILAAPTPRSMLAMSAYAASLAGLLGTSALYHRITWQPRARFWMGRLDLPMIFVLIAGTYTPVALLALPPQAAKAVPWTVWGAAVAGIVLKLVWWSPPKWVNSVVYVVMAFSGMYFFPEIARSIGTAATVMFVAGGVLYILGAVVYALQRPDPVPHAFGYHEIFHALVVMAASLHFAAVALYVLPGTD